MLICELEGNGRKYAFDCSPVLGTAGAKEAGTKFSLREQTLGQALGNGRLSETCTAVQPEDGLAIEIECPVFDLGQNLGPCTFQTTIVVRRTVGRIPHARKPIQV